MHSIESVAEEIRRYCVEHPDARDSLEGISWWLASQGAEVKQEHLRSAVALLVTRGALVAHRLHDGSIVFSCSKSSGAKGST